MSTQRKLPLAFARSSLIPLALSPPSLLTSFRISYSISSCCRINLNLPCSSSWLGKSNNAGTIHDPKQTPKQKYKKKKTKKEIHYKYKNKKKVKKKPLALFTFYGFTRGDFTWIRNTQKRVAKFVELRFVLKQKTKRNHPRHTHTLAHTQTFTATQTHPRYHMRQKLSFSVVVVVVDYLHLSPFTPTTTTKITKRVCCLCLCFPFQSTKFCSLSNFNCRRRLWSKLCNLSQLNC